jgi:hypothetical protein
MLLSLGMSLYFKSTVKKRKERESVMGVTSKQNKKAPARHVEGKTLFVRRKRANAGKQWMQQKTYKPEKKKSV